MVEDFSFVVFHIEGVGIDFCAIEQFWEYVHYSGVNIGVAHLELFVCEFAVNQEDRT